MQTALSWIWTQIAVSISYDDDGKILPSFVLVYS